MPDAKTDVKKFEIYPCGDPYSRAWDVSECVGKWETGSYVYRGDLSGRYRRTALKLHLRRTYPGCRIRDR